MDADSGQHRGFRMPFTALNAHASKRTEMDVQRS